MLVGDFGRKQVGSDEDHCVEVWVSPVVVWGPMGLASLFAASSSSVDRKLVPEAILSARPSTRPTSPETPSSGSSLFCALDQKLSFSLSSPLSCSFPSPSRTSFFTLSPSLSLSNPVAILSLLSVFFTLSSLPSALLDPSLIRVDAARARRFGWVERSGTGKVTRWPGSVAETIVTVLRRAGCRLDTLLGLLRSVSSE